MNEILVTVLGDALDGTRYLLEEADLDVTKGHERLEVPPTPVSGRVHGTKRSW